MDARIDRDGWFVDEAIFRDVTDPIFLARRDDTDLPAIRGQVRARPRGSACSAPSAASDALRSSTRRSRSCGAANSICATRARTFLISSRPFLGMITSADSLGPLAIVRSTRGILFSLLSHREPRGLGIPFH